MYIVLYNVMNLGVFSLIWLFTVLYSISVNTTSYKVNLVSFVQNNLITYNASITLNNLYNFGFLLAIFMIIQIVSGIILSIQYNFAFASIVYIVKDITVGWIFRYVHSMNCSVIHLFLLIHIFRGIYYLSYISTGNIWISGLVLYCLTVVISFLGYVLPIGQMSYWGATVITNIVALVPNVMELLLGNYVMSAVTLKRFYIFHFVASLILIVVMLVHIVYLHKLGSTNPLYYSQVKINFYPYFAYKDIYVIFLAGILLGINYFNFIELSHSDNNIEVNPLVTPLHIVPEWYFLAYYTVLKCINAKIAGILIMIAFFALLFNLVAINYTTILVWQSQNLYLVMDALAIYVIMMYVGAQLPLGIYLYLAKIIIIMIYARMFHANLAWKNSVTMYTYFAIQTYTYYYSVVNLWIYVVYSTMQVNLEIAESPINFLVLLGFIIISEMGLFLAFFGLLFDTYSAYVLVNHFHLYYIGLLILCHASLMANVYILFALSYAFINLQILEYRNMTYTINWNTYTSIFYTLTTLHLIHILIGVAMLLFNYYSHSLPYNVGSLKRTTTFLNSLRTYEYSVLINVYWNFVEFLWILIYMLYSWFHRKQLYEYASLNHKVIGYNYFILGAYFGLMAILYSMLIRVELFSTGNRIIFEQNNFIYNYLISIHGLMMIFFFIMPLVFSAFGNVYFPLNINAAELKLAKLNNLSLIFLCVSFVLVLNASLLEFGIGVGWTFYPPLSTYSINLSKLSLELLLIGLIFNGIASLLSSINFFVSLFYMMNIFVIQNLDLFSVATLMSSYMLILSLPVLTCGLLSVFLDILLNTILLDPANGGDPVFYQHLFWFFGHPEVYIMIIPSFGLINRFLIQLTAKATFGAVSMNLALVGITFLGFVVWAHHMYVAGMESDSRAYFTATTVMIAIPTGTKIFNWVTNFYTQFIYFTQINVFTLFFIVIFIIGGASGVMLGNAALDIMLHDTYYVVGHFHQVLAIASILSIVIMLLANQVNFHFLPVLGSYNNSNTNFLFANMFIHINMLFLNMIFLGFNVLPRRIPDYSDENTLWNALVSIHAITLLVLLVV